MGFYNINTSDDGQITYLCRQIMKNRKFINTDDVKILEFLSKKGDHNSKQAVLLEKNLIKKWKI